MGNLVNDVEAQILTSFNMAKQCTPISLSVSCNGIFVNSTPIIFDRNNIKFISSFIIVLDLPLYIKNDIIELKDVTGQISGKIVEILNSGVKSNKSRKINFDITTISTKYKYILKLVPTTELSVLINQQTAECFDNCKFEFKLDENIQIGDNNKNPIFKCVILKGYIRGCSTINNIKVYDTITTNNLIACNINIM